MIIRPRRAALIGAIAAIALAIIFYPLIVQTPIDLNKVSVGLAGVRLPPGESEDQKLTLEITFALENTNNFTLTTSKIEYELLADGDSIGSDTLSYEDVPLNGRPPLFPSSPIELKDFFDIEYSDSRAEMFNKIRNNSTQIEWNASGIAIIESGTTFVQKNF